MLPHDYLNFLLTGERVTEPGDASGTAYFDVRRRRWSEKMIASVDPSGKLAECLPRLIGSSSPAGKIRREIARKFGLPDTVVVSAGGGDNMVAAIGTGNVSPGTVTASLGTSGTIFAASDSPVTDPRGELAAFCSSTDSWLPLVCTMNVTVATEQVRALLGMTVKEFDAAVAAAEPGSGGMMLHPYFNGERTPALPDATAYFTGITSSNFTRENMCRAAMEGATLGLRYGLDVLRRRGIVPEEIRLTGGGAKSAVWRRIAADIFNCRVVCPVNSEAGAFGAALQALWCVSGVSGKSVPISDITERYCAVDPASAAKPSRNRAAFYDGVYDLYSTR